MIAHIRLVRELRTPFPFTVLLPGAVLTHNGNYAVNISAVELHGKSTGGLTKLCNEEPEVTGEWRKLHNKELHDLYSSPSIIRIIKSRRMRWAGHVARRGRRGTFIDYWWESQRERDH
jgi:hypothetical protein